MIRKPGERLLCLSRGGRPLHKMNKGLAVAAVLPALLVLSAAPAYAYIDPGTGSMIVQAIAASVLTAGAMVGVFWKAIKNFFLNIGKRRTSGPAENNQPAAGDQSAKKDAGQARHES